ncbi:uncharacterized protein LOC125298638 isoform X2 [Alosa alosa]|uniref:uncharacterized protein LOC125298638 isoform X2 n=1 Tax=Alosa alosa TaxID=278164 RepID=UPI0020153809|nr:uncharacterized protein LOC125298638 isoform X2 [Alosa alosa]
MFYDYIYSNEPAGETEDVSVGLAGVDTGAGQVVKPAPHPDHDYAEPSQSLEDQLEAARQEITRLTQENNILKASRFSLKHFENDSKLLTFYTGFRPTAEGMLRWNQAQKMVKQDQTRQEMALVGFRAESLCLFDQFFLFLCRVREGALEESLADRFHVSQSTVSGIIITWSNYLFFMLGSLPVWLHRSAVNAIMPQCFKDTFPRTRVILDCTEIYIEKASSKVISSETYSNYKGSTTLKGLIGVCPSGEKTFVSSLYEGSISDKQITKQSGILSLLEEGDEVMADKGFLIGDLLSPINASLVVPPFLNQRRQFTREEVTTTQQIARLRIHVERAIGRIKQHHVFDGVLPLSLLGTVNQLCIKVHSLQMVILLAHYKKITPFCSCKSHLSHDL